MTRTYHFFWTKLLIAIMTRVGSGSDVIWSNRLLNCGITKPKIIATTTTIRAERILGYVMELLIFEFRRSSFVYWSAILRAVRSSVPEVSAARNILIIRGGKTFPIFSIAFESGMPWSTYWSTCV